MEGASEEKLPSVSNLVTVFENSRYGVVGVGRVTMPTPGPLGSIRPSRPRSRTRAPWGPQRAAFSLGLSWTPLLTGQWATWSWAPWGLGECCWGSKELGRGESVPCVEESPNVYNYER